MLYDRSRNRSIKSARRGQLRYATRNYQNPFFSDRTSHRLPIPSYRLKLGLTAGITVLVILTGIALYSPYFRIRTVAVNGGSRVPAAEVERIVWEHLRRNTIVGWPADNLLTLRPDALRRLLESTYSFSSLSLDRRLPSTLAVDYAEKDYAFIWREAGKYYYIDEYGIVIEETDEAAIAGKQYLRLFNESSKMIENRQVPFAANVLPTALRLRDKMAAQGGEFTIDHFSIPSEFEQLTVHLVKGPRLLFSTKEDLDKQVSKLIILKEQTLKNTFADKEYIDLQYGDTIYIK